MDSNFVGCTFRSVASAQTPEAAPVRRARTSRRMSSGLGPYSMGKPKKERLMLLEVGAHTWVITQVRSGLF